MPHRRGAPAHHDPRRSLATARSVVILLWQFVCTSLRSAGLGTRPAGKEDFAEPVWEPFEMVVGDWALRLNVSETKDAVVVTAEMPGVDPKEIEIALTGDLLTLKGEKETVEKEERLHRVERTYGAFLRSVRLPMAVDGSKVTATFKNGVLVVTLPKTPASKGTTIPVKAE